MSYYIYGFCLFVTFKPLPDAAEQLKHLIFLRFDNAFAIEMPKRGE